MRTTLKTICYGFTYLLLGAFAADNTFVYPPDNGEVLYIPSGTQINVQWNCTYASINLRVVQDTGNGGYGAQTLLDSVSNPPGISSHSWVASPFTPSTGALHFEVAQQGVGQAPSFDSGSFYITNSSAMSTSGAPKSTSTVPAASSAPTSSSAAGDKGSLRGSQNLGLALCLGVGYHYYSSS